MEVEIQYHGFRIKREGLLILINQEGKEKWQYDFYRIYKENDEEKTKPLCAPFEAKGSPWQMSRYKDSLLSKCISKAHKYAEKEEIDEIVDEITTKLYNMSDDYKEIQQHRSGYDYNNTIDGIPTSILKGKIHPAMDYFNGDLFIGYRFIDDLMNKREWMVDSNKKVWTPEQLLDEAKILLKDKSIIGEQRWVDVGILKGKSMDAYNLFMLIKQKLQHHVWFTEPLSYDILSLWIMGTYMYWAFDSYPYIHLSGTPDSGKSTVQKITSFLSFNGYFTESISNSSIFRYVEEMRATLCIDEQEFLGDENASETKSILNSGYHKSGNATRQEQYTDKDGNKKFMTVSFSTYSPKMLSGIRGLDKTLQTRSINIPMKPTTDREYSRRRLMDNDTTWQVIRDQLYAWALDSFEDVMYCYNEVKQQENIDIKNRMWQKYHAIIALAYYFKKIVSSSDVHDNVIKFIQTDQIKSLEWDDFIIDTTYKVLYECVNKYPSPKGQYSLKLIREVMAMKLGYQPPFDREFFEDPSRQFIKNIHTVLKTIGYKPVGLAGNYRGIYIKKEILETEALARGINLASPVITL